MGVSPRWSGSRGRRRRRRGGSGGGCGDDDGGDGGGWKRRRRQRQQHQLRLSGVAVAVATAAAAAGRPSWLDVEASALAATTTTSVAVMAPALTEGGPQKPENLLPALPAGGFLSAEQAKQVCQNREVLAQFVVSANVQPSKIDEQCLHGIPKDLIDDVINLKFGSGLDGLSDLIVGGGPRKEAREAQTAASSAAIMNDPSMGDPVDSMCFFKIMGPGEAEGSCEITDLAEDVASAAAAAAAAVAQEANVNDTIVSEDKQIEEDKSLEQIMGFAADINVQSGDLGHVEDILQALNSMDTAAETGETLGGDNRLTGGCGGLVEGVVSSQSVSEGGVSEIFPDGEAFPLNLLNDVDVIGLCNDNICDNNVVVDQHQAHQQLLHQQPTKLTELARHQEQIERRQHELERRSAFLLRRLRKLQSQLVGEHVSEEAGHVLEAAQKSAKKCLYQNLASLGQKAGNTRIFPELAGSISSFLLKVQKSCNAQSNSIAVRQRNSCRYFGAGSRDNYASSNVNRVPVFGVPQIKIEGEPLEQVAGPLSTKLKILQSAYDSDCTASSSGGESCDEMQTFNNPHQQQLPISKRAGWRYAQERASIASRWTWLQAQISDLEYKIRQHNELQRQIRSTKGLVMLEASSTSSSVSTSSSSASLMTLGSTSIGSESTINGYSGVLPGSAVARGCGGLLDPGADPTSASFGSSRTRPFVRHAFRKRKLVQLDGLHLQSKKAARPTSVRCSCDGSHAPCALCTGRRDPTIGQDVELLSVQERLALVDPCYHPVLSMPDEITLTTHMNAIMRSTEWQQKVAKGSLRLSKLKDKDGHERRNKRVTEHRTKCPPRLKKSQTALISTSKRSRNNNERTNYGISSRKRTTKQQQAQQQQQQQTAQPQPQSQQQQPQQLLLQSSPLDAEEEATSTLSSSSKYSSPVPSPLLLQQQQQQQQQPGIQTATSSSATATPAAVAATPLPPPAEKNTLKEKSSNSHSHSRLRQNSYDIDNIVIPYSVAASTRLEKLPYKEIQIPKWRLCDEPSTLDVKNGAVQKSMPDSDVEDVSEEAVALRHERSERDEAKRFMSYSLPFQSRIRHSRRLPDSGANTPDPMSPHASDFGGDTMSPITSPPATPSNVHDAEHLESHHRSGSLQNAFRRRTMPLRSQKEETLSVINEEEHEQILPYEPRTFPLTDEDYDKMLEVMPGGHLQPLATSICSQDDDKIDEAEIDSQESDSTESALCDMEGEDPNDPEWTVAEARETEKERIRPTVKR